MAQLPPIHHLRLRGRPQLAAVLTATKVPRRVVADIKPDVLRGMSSPDRRRGRLGPDALNSGPSAHTRQR